jgi:hypothetical protein
MKVIDDLTNLSEAVDQAAPDKKKLVEAVRSQKDRIEVEIKQYGYANVTVSGQTFRVLSSEK